MDETGGVAAGMNGLAVEVGARQVSLSNCGSGSKPNKHRTGKPGRGAFSTRLADVLDGRSHRSPAGPARITCERITRGFARRTEVSTIRLRGRAIACMVTFGVILGACATGSRAFPTHPSEAPPAIQRATVRIADAVAAGADSLAPEPLTSAKQHLAEAQSERQGKHPDRAPVSARLAEADAVYAKALAQCMSAERSLASEQAALAAMPHVPTTPAAPASTGAPPAGPPPATSSPQ
jgi:hypothetical protein